MRFSFSGSGGKIEINASYTPYDSFNDFVMAIQSTYEYGGASVVKFNEEPREIELILERNGDNLVISSKGLTEDIQIVASFETGCREIARSFHRLLQQVGYDDFVDAWGHRPPKKQIREFWEQFKFIKK